MLKSRHAVSRQPVVRVIRASAGTPIMLPHGLEPWTTRLLAERSNQLSYESCWWRRHPKLHGAKGARSVARPVCPLGLPALFAGPTCPPGLAAQFAHPICPLNLPARTNSRGNPTGQRVISLIAGLGVGGGCVELQHPTASDNLQACQACRVPAGSLVAQGGVVP